MGWVGWKVGEKDGMDGRKGWVGWDGMDGMVGGKDGMGWDGMGWDTGIVVSTLTLEDYAPPHSYYYTHARVLDAGGPEKHDSIALPAKTGYRLKQKAGKRPRMQSGMVLSMKPDRRRAEQGREQEVQEDRQEVQEDRQVGRAPSEQAWEAGQAWQQGEWQQKCLREGSQPGQGGQTCLRGLQVG